MFLKREINFPTTFPRSCHAFVNSLSRIVSIKNSDLNLYFRKHLASETNVVPNTRLAK
jgi:hypothetical protein